MKASTLLSIARARLSNKPVPIAVGFEVTHLCNLDCDYCDRHHQLANEMNFAEIVEALDGLISLGMREISLDGGEALTHPKIEEIVSWLAARNVVMRLNSNGVLVRRKANVVKKMQKLKISLDGPPRIHDSIRGKRAFEWAIDAVAVADALSLPVELTCAIGKHNAPAVDELLSIVESIGAKIIFQPVRPSLFHGQAGPADDWTLLPSEADAVFARIAEHKRAGRPVLNRWSSLRHFRAFPRNQSLPCAAGWINLTLDPAGNLYHCGQSNRSNVSNNIVKLGAGEAVGRLTRQGCSQCWCARVVEENYAWGGRVDRMLPPRRESASRVSKPLHPRGPETPRLDVPLSALLRKA
jgi:MoaA/NifB/PqqE/SkfB family radical SAM enzyme